MNTNAKIVDYQKYNVDYQSLQTKIDFIRFSDFIYSDVKNLEKELKVIRYQIKMTSKRSQDFLLVMSGLQKVANLVVKQEQTAISKIKTDYASLNQLVQKGQKSTFEPLLTMDGQLLTKKSGMMLENALIMTQSLAVSSLQHNLPELNNQINQISNQIRKQDLVEKSATQEENSDNLYEPNSSITALELIERIPDLTDRRKILSTVFIKKMKLKQPEAMDETTIDINTESHEPSDESITPVAKSYEVQLDAFSQFFVKSVQVTYGPLAYFSDIFISGKNVVSSVQKRQHFCQK